MSRSGRLSWRLAVTTFFLVAALIALWVTGISPTGIVSAIYWPGIFVLQLTVIATPWRAVPLKWVGLMFLLGMSIVPATAFGAQAALYSAVNLDTVQHWLVSDDVLGNYDLMAPVVAPITEEILKAAPLLVFLLWGRQAAWRRILGPLDLAVLAAASGAGFEFIENLFRVADGYWAPLGPDRVVPVASPAIGPFYLFPDMTASTFYGVPTVWFGHGEMAAWVGLTLGLGLYVRRRFRLWWIIPCGALLWAIWDHFLVNYLGPTPSQTWAQVLPAIDLHGQLLPYVFAAAFVLSIYLASRTQRLYLSVDREAALDSPGQAALASLFSSPRSIPKRAIALWRFWRLRRMVAYAVLDFKQSPPERAVHRAAWVEALREQMLDQKRIFNP